MMFNLSNFIEPYGIIYMIRNKTNDKKYIGQTTLDLNKRCYWSKSSILRNYQYNSHLINSIKKYSFMKFERKILDFAQDQDKLDEKEEFYILKYNTLDSNFGYNMKEGGSYGKHIQESKDIISKKAKEQWNDPEIREKRREGIKNAKRTKEWNKNISKAHKKLGRWKGEIAPHGETI